MEELEGRTLPSTFGSVLPLAPLAHHVQHDLAHLASDVQGLTAALGPHVSPAVATDLGTLAEVVSGKVAGLRNLDTSLDQESLDAVVLFSSIAGVWGVGEHGAYAAANAHLDAFAQARAANGLPVLSVAWGPWAGGGMIPEELQDTLLRRGVPVSGAVPKDVGMAPNTSPTRRI